MFLQLLFWEEAIHLTEMSLLMHETRMEEAHETLRRQFCPALQRMDQRQVRMRQFKALKALFGLYELDDDDEEATTPLAEIKTKTAWLVDLLDDVTGRMHEEIRQTGQLNQTT